MRNTLLIAAAALAAGVIVSKAQVYSQNIVGYVNRALPPGFTFLVNPVNAIDPTTGLVNNAATNVISNPYNAGLGQGPLDSDTLLTWNVTHYNTYVFYSNPSDTPTGFTDNNGSPLPTPTLNPGSGFYINNLTTSTNILTYVGSVAGVQSGGTIVSNVLTIPNQSFNFIGSVTPIGGDIVTNLQLANPYNPVSQVGPLDSCKILVPNYNVAGQLISYTSYVFDSNPSDTPTGFTDNNGSPLPAPTFNVGDAVQFNNNNNASITWTQVLNLQ